MKFSVIVPAHNVESYISKAIESVYAQNYKDYELIVVCDSCTDGTKAIVESYGIKPIISNAKCAGGARNAGLDAAKGDYVLFLDADDYYLTNYVFSSLAAFVAAYNPDVLHFGFNYGNAPVAVYGNRGAMWCNVWSRVWKRSAIGKTRFTTDKIAEDLKFCDEMFAKDISHTVYDVPLVQYTYPRVGSLTWEVQNGKNFNSRADNSSRSKRSVKK